MVKYKAYKYRLYPNDKQKVIIAKNIGSARFVYNHFLELWNKSFVDTGKGLSYNSCSALLPAMKKEEETQWLKEVDSIALQSSIRDLSDSFSRFFKKQNAFPVFKKKSTARKSYTTKNVSDNIMLVNNHVKLPKLGLVKFANSRKIKGRIMSATVSMNSSGKYFISLLSEEEVLEMDKSNSNIGIDLGINHFASLSDGTKVNNLRFSKALALKLAREQRKLSKRYEGAKKNGIKLSDAKNYQKQKIIVAKIHERIANQRNDFLNKLSTDIIKNHDIICIEDLNVKGMVKNRHLAKHISDVSWSNFISKLEYKADWYGKKVVMVDRWYPSSQLCSQCGENDGKKQLDIRIWNCSACDYEHDRDINASVNILKEGLRIYSLA